jgi:D-amino-acid dehydrogenase
MEGAALRAHDPGFSDALGFAACLPDHGHVSDPGAYVQALARHFETSGGRLLRAEVDDIVHAAGRVTGVRAGGATLPCDAVVLTAGAHSAPLARRMGLRIPLETERGYHLDLWAPSATPRAPVMVTEGQFVAVPMDGRLRLAGILEFGGLDAPPSAAPFDLLRRAIRRAMPGLRWAREERWMGHRPATPDSLPVIGPAPGLDGAWLGFGHHHVGLTAGPRTGRLLAQCIAGNRPNIDMAPYAPARFAGR